MISRVKSDGQIADNVCVYFGKSTDDKTALIQDGLPNGSIFYEINTQDIYIFDEDGQTWIKQ